MTWDGGGVEGTLAYGVVAGRDAVGTWTGRETGDEDLGGSKLRKSLSYG